MSTDARRDDDRFGAEPRERQPRSAMSTCLVGCLITFLVVLVLGIIAGVWVWYNWRDWAAAAGSQALKQGIEQTQLPADEKQDINLQIDRVAEAFRTEQISTKKLADLVQDLADSPLMTSIAASAIDAHYIARSGLSDEEKTEATQTLRRFLRGVVDKKINEGAVDSAMAHVADREADGSWELRDQISDEDLRKFLEVAKAEADKAQIPAEPEDFDPSDEMKRIVDEALGP